MATVSRSALQQFARENPARYLEVFGDNDPLGASGLIKAELLPAQATTPPQESAVGRIARNFTQGVSAGVDGLQAGGAGLLALAANAVGATNARDNLLDVYRRNLAEADAAKIDVRSLGDVESVGDAGLFAVQGLGQLVPSLVGSVISGGLGALAVRGGAAAAGREAATLAGQQAGQELAEEGVQRAVQAIGAQAAGRVSARAATVGSAGFEGAVIAGDTFGTNAEQGDYSSLKALGSGVVGGALGGIADARIARTLLGGGQRGGLLREAMISAGLEGGTETLQSASQRLFTGKDLTADPVEYLDSLALGAIGGGLVGGAARAYSGPQPIENPQDELELAINRSFQQRSELADSRGLLAPKPFAAGSSSPAIDPTLDFSGRPSVQRFLAEQEAATQAALERASRVDGEAPTFTPAERARQQLALPAPVDPQEIQGEFRSLGRAPSPPSAAPIALPEAAPSSRGALPAPQDFAVSAAGEVTQGLPAREGPIVMPDRRRADGLTAVVPRGQPPSPSPAPPPGAQPTPNQPAPSGLFVVPETATVGTQLLVKGEAQALAPLVEGVRNVRYDAKRGGYLVPAAFRGEVMGRIDSARAQQEQSADVSNTGSPANRSTPEGSPQGLGNPRADAPGGLEAVSPGAAKAAPATRTDAGSGAPAAGVREQSEPAPALSPPAQDQGGRTPPVGAGSTQPTTAMEFVPFAKESGTLGIPRAEMPQVKSSDRSALVQYLRARDIDYTEQEVDAGSLKATQAEFSPAKVQKAKEFTGGNRSILVSSDGYIVDGHHQALAAVEKGEPIRAIRLDAPIKQLLPLVREFPSASVDTSSNSSNVERAAAPAAAAVPSNRDQSVDTEQPNPTQQPQARARRGTPSDEEVRALLSDAKLRERVEGFAAGAGWAVKGGEMTFSPEQGGQRGNARTAAEFGTQDADLMPSGRTAWIPNEPWFPAVQRDAPLANNADGSASREAVRKAIAGERMTPAERRHVAELARAAKDEITAEHDAFSDLMMQAMEGTGLDATSEQDHIDVDLLTRAYEIVGRDAALEAQQEYETDERLLLWAKGVVDGQQRASGGAAQGGNGADQNQSSQGGQQEVADGQQTESSGADQGREDAQQAQGREGRAAESAARVPAAAEDFALEQQTEADLAEKAAREAEPVDEDAARKQSEADDAAKADVTRRQRGLLPPSELVRASDQRRELAVRNAPEAGAGGGLFAGAPKQAEKPPVSAVSAENPKKAAVDGPFGPVFTGLTNQPEAAIEKLMAEKRGEVEDAFAHPELGNIAFVYGDEKMGLRHIAEKRGMEWVNRIPSILRNGEVTPDENGLPRTYLVRRSDDPASIAVIRLDWNGAEKTWLVTAYPDDFGKFSGNKKPDISQKHTGGADDGVRGFSNPSGEEKTTPDPESSPAAARIEDFGERILGARKDFAARMEEAEAKDVAAVPLSESWPEPDYDKLLAAGADLKIVAFIHAARDEIPTKPQKSWKLKAWVSQVGALRNFSKDALAGQYSAEGLYEKARTSALLSPVLDRAELYERVGHGQSLKGIRVSKGSYSLYGGQKFDPPKVIWSVEKEAKATAFGNWPRQLGTGDTREKAIDAFVVKWMAEQMSGAAPARPTVRFDIYGRASAKGRVFIGRKIGSRAIDLKSFDSVKEARAYLAENREALEAQWAKLREEPDTRKDGNSPRVGGDHRNGADVTPTQFAEAFGFRGVQFGNYVEGKRRQKDLNDAYDALMDLAGVLNIPPKAISLNGKLGLAFGARGTGGRNAGAAHYESGQVVINLTKANGAGSLAHEWWHALDNYFSRMRGEAGGFQTEAKPRTANDVGIREEMRAAFVGVMRAINTTRMRERAAELDKMRTKDYWTTDREMSARAFESYVIAKLGDQGVANDYLANVVSNDAFDREGAYPYPTAAEIPAIRAGFDELFQAVQTREDDAGNVAMFSLSDTLKAEPGIKSLPMDQVQRTVASIRAKWENGPKIVVLTSMEDAATPSAVQDAYQRQNANGATGVPRGFITQDGTVYLVAGALRTPREVAETLFHEALGHYGLRGIYGKELVGILRGVANLRRADVDAKMREYGFEDTPVNRLRAAEEVLAEMAQNTPTLGWVKQAIAAIRKFLRELGVPMALSDNDIIASYILPARRWVEQGSNRSVATSGARIGDAQPAFSVGDSQNPPEYIGDDGIDDEPGEPGSAVGMRQSRGRLRGRFRALGNINPVDAIRDRVAAGLQAPGARGDYPTSPLDGSVGNRVDFSLGSAPQPAQRASWEAPERSKLDDLIYKMQDKQVDTRRVVAAVQQAGIQLQNANNPYLQEELYHGRAAKATQDFLNDELKPTLKALLDRGLTIAEVEEYLHNRHAEEANRHIAKINPDLADGGSGIKTSEAKAYLAGLSASKRGDLEAVGRQIDAIIARTRDMLVDYGLESQQTVDSWASSYAHYVPLNREDMDGGTGLGQGYSVKGSSSKQRTGSTRKVVDILANIALQREKAIVRGEKNRVANALYGLAKTAPNPDFWVADAIPTMKVVNESTGLVETRIDPLYKTRPNVVMARMPDGNGGVVDRAVTFNEQNERAVRMAEALKNLDMDQLGFVMGNFAKVTRYLASVNTQYNPIFGVVNLFRDVQGALLNLSTTQIAGEQREVFKHLLPALRGVYLDSRAARKGEKTTSSWAQLWDEFQTVGGQTGYRDLFRTSKDRAEALQSELKQVGENKLKAGGRAVFDWLSDYNQAMENGIRLAAYKVAKDKGIEPETAASIAKNLTVNFNRKGQVATQAGALYAFFNASAQGTARLLETMSGPAGKKIIAGGILLGVMQALMMDWADFEEGEPPDFIRERNLIIPIGGKDYLSIPMPLGLHVIPTTGRVVTEFALSGFKDGGKRMAGLFMTYMEAFNPIGTSGSVAQTLAPSIADPVVALSENKDFTGKPIYREDFNSLRPTPGHARAKDTATWWSQTISKTLNLMSGGTDYTPGLFSPTPDQIDYLIGQVTGGVGREVGKLEQTVSSVFSGEDLPSYKVPLFGRFYGETDGAANEAGRFYDNLKKLAIHRQEIIGRRENGEDVAGYIAEHPESKLWTLANQSYRQVQLLRKRKRALLEQGASADQVRAVEQQITLRMRQINSRISVLKEAA